MTMMVNGVSHVDKEELQALLKDDSRAAVIIDVREREEYIAGHIPSVPLIPMGEIAEYADDMDKDREYIFICRSGQRSLNVTRYFQELGFTNVHNFYGGMLGWDQEVAEGPEHIIDDFRSMDQLNRA